MGGPAFRPAAALAPTAPLKGGEQIGGAGRARAGIDAKTETVPQRPSPGRTGGGRPARGAAEPPLT
jgi:hypothetical protein